MPLFFSVFTASQYGDLDGVRRFFDKGKAGLDFADDYGYSALHLSAQGNHVKIVRYLLARGALVDAAPASRCTPLHRAAASGALECCELLVRAGASLEAVDTSFGDQRTPLLKACSAGHDRVVAFLLSRGACVDVTDKGGLGPREVAAEFPNVLRLLDPGPPISDIQGEPAMPFQKQHPSDAKRLLSGFEALSRLNTAHALEPVASAPTPSGSTAKTAGAFGMQCPTCRCDILVAARTRCCQALMCRSCASRTRLGSCGACAPPSAGANAFAVKPSSGEQRHES